MLAMVNTLALTGIEAKPVMVEIDIQNGLPAFEIVGLASTAIKEARERVRAAIKNSGFKFPNRKIIVNLAPADFKKEGSHFDLAIAVGILIASGQLENNLPASYFLAGELSLNGAVRAVPGILPMALELEAAAGEPRLVIPEENCAEAALVREVSSYQVSHLHDICRFISEAQPLKPVIYTADGEINLPPIDAPDFAEVKGQENAKRALQIAAAGLHNVLLIGPPGGGKTMLARRMPGILPEMTREEVLQTTRIYSVANLLNGNTPLITQRPFRTPHKNASTASIVGGGRIPKPGEISLAQNGVLFLDELPEFSRDVLEALRQPLEDKIVTIARTQATYTYPADFSLISSCNPCPCGNFGSELECSCTPLQIHKYLGRISGPLLDRMDLHVEVPRIQYEQLQDQSRTENSASIRARVKQAREMQSRRFAGTKITLNSQMTPAMVKAYCKLDMKSEQMLKQAFNRFNMSARAYDRILKVARTIADLEGSADIKAQHVAEAIQYRSLDRKYWRNL
ncbi:MAG: YifB family Mg chelatase-like AAA ATPase [Syntrophomonadaceae bacterium]|nr:YifB family Mg chelatase-like AAA ATPase [Syntrophomonadaceae bacterium]